MAGTKLSRGANAVVTGAGSGIGRAFAVNLARRGGRVVCADVDADGGTETVRIIESAGGSAVYVDCDVADVAQVQALAERAEKWFGSETSVLVNNAGVAVGGRIGDVSLEDWQWIMGVNLWGVIYGCHEFVPRFRAAGRGGIINVASMAGFAAAPDMGPYCVTKYGVVALSETLSGELRGANVHVTTLCPTFVKTNIVRNARIHSDNLRLAERLMDWTGRDPEKIAGEALDALDRNQLYVVPQVDAKILWRLKRLLPRTVTRGLGMAYHLGER